MGEFSALITSFIYGVTDFAEARNVRFTSVLAVAQIMALGSFIFWLTTALFFNLNVNLTTSGLVSTAIIGMLVVGAKLLSLKAFQAGPVSIVVAASGAAIAAPFIYDLIVGKVPTLLQTIGIASISIGLLLITRKGDGGSFSLKALFLGLAAASCYGLVDVVLKIGMHDIFGITFSVALFKLIVFSFAVFAKKTNLKMDPQIFAILFCIGIANGAAMFFFARSLESGNVGISSILASLSPLFTTGLAYLFLQERLSKLQLIGLCLAVFGVIPMT